jgi:hypothetical protein
VIDLRCRIIASALSKLRRGPPTCSETKSRGALLLGRRRKHCHSRPLLSWPASGTPLTADCLLQCVEGWRIWPSGPQRAPAYGDASPVFRCSRSEEGPGVDVALSRRCPASTRRAASSETEYATATVCVLPILSRHGPEVRMECCTAARQRLPRVQGAGFLRKHSRSGQPLSAALMCWIRLGADGGELRKLAPSAARGSRVRWALA